MATTATDIEIFSPDRKRSRSSLDLVTTSISGRCSTFQAGISDSRGPNVSLESFQVWTPYHKRQQQLFFEEDGIRQTQTDCSLFGILPDDILEMVLLFAVRGHADISTNSRVCRRWRIFVNHENVWKRMCLRGWQNKDSVILTGFFKPRNKTWKQAYVSRLVGTHLHFMIPQQFLSVSVRSILVNWLLALLDEFTTSSGPWSQHQCVSLFDRYCHGTTKVIHTHQLQTLGAACAILALNGSCTIDAIPEASFHKAAYYTNGACNGDEVREAAIECLSVVCKDGPPTVPVYETSFDYIDQMLEAMQKHSPTSSTYCLAHYLGELALQSETSLKYSAQIVGASAFSLACHNLGWPEESWFTYVKDWSTVTTLAELRGCMTELHQLLKQSFKVLWKVGGSCPHVIAKYSKRDRQQVSKVLLQQLPWDSPVTPTSTEQ